MPIIEKKKKEKKLLELTASIVLKYPEATQIPETSARIVLEDDNLSIFPEGWGTYVFSYREILKAIPNDYKLNLMLSKGNELIISKLGYQYDDFVRMFIKLRNGALLKDMLFQETLKKSGFEADFSFFNENNLIKQSGKTEFVFYQTSLVLLPEQEELIKIPFSNISEIKFENYQIEIKVENEDKIVISKLGDKFDLFQETMNNCLNEINLNIQEFIKGTWPEVDFDTLNKLSKLIKEGKAIAKKNIEKVAVDFWEKFEKALTRTEVKEEYEFLKAMNKNNNIYLGFKKGLMGKLTGDYLWFFIPIYDDKLSNAIAFETAGEKDKGRATYFFRIVSRKEFQNLSKEELDDKANEIITKINNGLNAINFRREPIYLPEEKLEEPEYVKYKFSMAKIPEIQLMRDLFIGRIIHKDNKQWQKDVLELLAFNVKSENDSEKWINTNTKDKESPK